MRTRHFPKALVSLGLCLLLLSGALPAAAQSQPAYPFSFAYSYDVIEGAYLLHNQFTATYLYVDWDRHMEFWDALAEMNPSPAQAPAEQTAALYRFTVNLRDGTIYTYTLYPSPLLEVDGALYTIDQAAWEVINAYLDDCSPPDRLVDSSHPQWLIELDEARVSEILTSVNPQAPRLPLDSGNWEPFLETLRSIHVEPDSCQAYLFPKAFTPSADMILIQIYLDDGTAYTLWIEDRTTLYVETGAAAYGCRFTLSGVRNAAYNDVIRWILDPSTWEPEAMEITDNPETGKPVIYLYPQEPTAVTVSLDFQGELLNTDPPYHGGWAVTAYPDGRLENHEDGSVHEYLFWDGTAWNTHWDFSSGFVVAGEESELFLRDVLPRLGLTPAEYSGFIDYWAPELRQNPYNLITFATEEYERIAPLDISPAPDTLLRVHMVYKALEQPVDVPQQALPTPPARQGFTVVEWGGTRG